jgi:hypothetical protein
MAVSARVGKYPCRCQWRRPQNWMPGITMCDACPHQPIERQRVRVSRFSKLTAGPRSRRQQVGQSKGGGNMDRLANSKPHKELREIGVNIMRCHVRISAGCCWHRASAHRCVRISHFDPASLTIGHQSFCSVSMKRMMSAVDIGRKGVPICSKRDWRCGSCSALRRSSLSC